MKPVFLLLLLALAACTASPSNSEDALTGATTTVAPTTAATRHAPAVEKNGTPLPPSVTTADSDAAETRYATESAAEPQASATAESSPTPEPSPTPLGPQEINGIPLSSLVVFTPETAANIAAIYERGQTLGRDPNAFSKLGDSTILNPHFLGPFDAGEYDLGDFAYLQPTIGRWSGSFARHGVGANHGLHSWTVFDPMWANEKWCLAGEHLLACEIRLQNPSVIFIRLGSNDAGSPSGFRFNVREVITYAIENGVIPIIGTKADRFEGSNENNEILRELAAEYHVPLWDFDLLAETLPGRDLDTDGVHLKIHDLPHEYTNPATFERGHAMQDLTALIALDQVRRIIEGEEIGD